MKMNKSKTNLIITVAVLILVVFGLYVFGHRVPVIKNISYFKDQHDHQYMPVTDEKGDIEYWTCAMHPSVKMKEPGKCPICGMELVPAGRKQAAQSGSATDKAESTKQDQSMDDSADHSKHDMKTESSEMQNDSSAFTVNPRRQQLINIKTEPVQTMEMTKTIRTVGTVELDETKIEHIHTKFSGWIDKVYVDYKWQHVKKGDPLFSIYSPELVSTQEEYLLALKSNRILSGSKFENVSEGSRSLLRAAKRRLELWDVSDSQINEIRRTGRVKKSITIYSPIEGHVSFKNAYENQHVKPDTLIYTIADHTTAWVNAEIYEDEIPLIDVGQEATLTVESYPGEEFHGKVTFKWPHLMPDTRTTKVRFEFPNPNLKLLPEMYADVYLEVPLGKKLAVPASAVLRTGKQNVVFVDKGNGYMDARKVELGRKAGDYYQVLRGLEEGETVVSSANFLIDAESKLQAATATWNDGTTGEVEIDDGNKMKRDKNDQNSEQRHIH